MALHKFRSFEIAENDQGASLELWRGEREVVCLASDVRRLQFVELHVLSEGGAGAEAGGLASENFLAQAQSLMRISHPNVAELREFGEDEGTYFFISEFVDGEVLDSFLARCNPLPGWLAVEIARQLVAGLLACRAEPTLLARVDLFNSRLALEGETTADLVVKLCDFGLASDAPREDGAPEFEARCVRDAGRILLYALSGLISDRLTARTLATLPVPPQLGQLLTRVLDSGSRQSMRALPELADMLRACGKVDSLVIHPERLPVTLRPRLPLQAHFPTLPDLAEKLAANWRLERTAFDALQPYAQRAFGERAQAVTIQLLPPARILTPGHLALVRRAARRIPPDGYPRLLRIIDVPDGEAPEWFIEEAAPRLTVDGARRLRKQLAPAETALLVREVEKAVSEAEKLELPAVAGAPQLAFIEFFNRGDSSAEPPEATLAATPITDWPTFRVRLRTWPTTLTMTQPNRFRRERLLGKHAPATRDEGAAGLGIPEAADYAALIVSLMGGEANVPEPAMGMIEHALSGVGNIDRRVFVQQITAALAPRAPRGSRAGSARSNGRLGSRSGDAPTSEKADVRGRSRVRAPRPAAGPRPPGARRDLPPPTPAESPAPEPEHAAVESSVGDEPVLDFSALARAELAPVESEEADGGFAEVLFGGRPTVAPAPAIEPEFTDDPEGSAPIGGLFAAGQGEFDGESGDDTPRLDFHRGAGAKPAVGIGRLVLLMVVAALTIALITAHLTGLAPWVGSR